MIQDISRFLPLNFYEEQKVNKCCKYANNKDVIYRTSNAIKAIFGRSDWQVASKILRDKVMIKYEGLTESEQKDLMCGLPTEKWLKYRTNLFANSVLNSLVFTDGEDTAYLFENKFGIRDTEPTFPAWAHILYNFAKRIGL